jgi:hypothetical protein
MASSALRLLYLRVKRSRHVTELGLEASEKKEISAFVGSRIPASKFVFIHFTEFSNRTLLIYSVVYVTNLSVAVIIACRRQQIKLKYAPITYNFNLLD